MRKVLKPIILLIVIVIFIGQNQIVYAGGRYSDSMYPLYNLNQFEPDYDINDGNKITSKVQIVIGIIKGIGSVVSVIALIIIGIKYMLGSVEERAEYKKTMLVYVLGAFLVFAITALPSLIYNVANKGGTQQSSASAGTTITTKNKK